MKRRALDKDTGFMIGLNTCLFGVGAVLVALNFISNLGNVEYSLEMLWSLGVAQIMHISTFAILLGGCFYSLVILRPDIASRKRERKLLELKMEAAEERSYIDAFTGLYNHLYFDKTLNTYLEEANSVDVGVGLLFVEIDNLRQFNFINGENLEDRLLKTIGDNLINTAREYDVIARVGVKKFGVLVPKIQADDLAAITGRFSSIIRNSKLEEGHPELKFTIGSSFYEKQTCEAFKDAANQHLKVVRRLSTEPVKLAMAS